MTFKRSFTPEASDKERRSGLNRRWIKAPYDGVDRRRRQDRRNDAAPEEPLAAAGVDPERYESVDALLVSTALRLEALARLLIDKGVLSHQELVDALRTMQRDYDRPRLKKE
ncbi:MAG: hypothetical protein MUE48_02455 [Desulfobacterales bacterium]|jgi:hypothetical protein|nr:hypothetical protein [Desulfobacterales bacterium]